MTEILTRLAPLTESINQTMARLIKQDAENVGRVAYYSFQGGGKRLRPLIFCLISQSLGIRLDDKCLEIASSFEFLHMATLMHDDIVDMAELRRGSLAAHLHFSVPEAVLAGDYLLAKAALLGTQTNNMQCVRLMSGIVGSLAVGELIQLKARRNSALTEEEYFGIIYRKTAALIEGAAQTAAILSGAPNDKCQAAALFGCKLGLAFQIMDDILDYESDPLTLGKPVGHDLDEGNITLPFIYARNSLDKATQKRLETLGAMDFHDEKSKNEVFELVHLGNGIAQAKKKVELLINEALNQLSAFEDNQIKDDLHALALYMIDRNH